MDARCMFEQNNLSVLHLHYLAAASIIFAVIYLICKPNKVYLVDFTCFRGPDNLRVPIASFIEHTEATGKYSRETIEFQKKVITRAGIGNETYLPQGLHQLPADNSFNVTMEEIKQVPFSVVHDLFTKHAINPRSIDIVITNSSLTNPTPSLASLIINEFGLRSNIKSYNLSGMGCSAGILSISLAKDLLRVHKNCLALVLSMEAISGNVYQGKKTSMLLANCLFRMGGAGILLSNKPSDRNKAKYELQHVVRTHLGSKTSAYECVVQETDEEGNTGVSLSRAVLQVAGDALKTNLSALGMISLPYSEQIRYVLSRAWKIIRAPARKTGTYIPDFKKAFQHFCIHAGGRAVIHTIKEKLRLSEKDIEASKMALYRFGNTSSSSTWYSLAYLEGKGRVERGDRVWQLAFGSGFKCNSAVWKCIRKVEAGDDSNAWFDRIDRYPVRVPEKMDS